MKTYTRILQNCNSSAKCMEKIHTCTSFMYLPRRSALSL